MATRRDKLGRVLRKGESYKKSKNLYVYAYTDALGKRRYVYSKDLITLRDKEEQIQKDRLDRLGFYCIGKADINYVFDRYLSTKKNLRETTKASYIYTYDRYVRSGFGKKYISDIRYSDIVLFYNSMLQQGLGVNTVDNVHCLLHPTFEMAVRDNVIRNNPANGALGEIKKNSSKSEKRHALTYEEETARRCSHRHSRYAAHDRRGCRGHKRVWPDKAFPGPGRKHRFHRQNHDNRTDLGRKVLQR